jgi:hypothetical protein
MPEKEKGPGCGGPKELLDWLKVAPGDPVASSDRRGWVGLQAARYGAYPAFELHQPALTHHMLVLFARPPEALDVRYEGVKLHVPPPAGSVLLMPAGSPARVLSGGHRDELHVFLEPGLVRRVAAEAFDLDPARLMVPPLDGLELPQLRAAGRDGGGGCRTRGSSAGRTVDQHDSRKGSAGGAHVPSRRPRQPRGAPRRRGALRRRLRPPDGRLPAGHRPGRTRVAQA